MGYQGYQGYGPKADIAQLLIQQQAAQANGMKGAPGAGAPFPPSQYPQSAGGPDLGAIPDIGSAEQQAGSSRKIADLLMDRAMSRNQQGDVVNWGTGLGQLGEALLARNANKKADAAEAKFATAESDKRQQIAQLLANASKASPEQQALLQAGVGMDAAAQQAFAPPPKPLEINGQLVDPTTYEPIADFRTEQAPDAPDYDTWEDGNKRMTGILGQPDTYQEIGEVYRKPEGGGGSGEYGLAPIYGRDADGNRVLIQANKAGGVRQADLPEGVTLEDDRFKSSQRALGTAEGKKAAYQTEAGQAVVAVQDKADFIMSQIDRAIEQSDGWNTGMSSKLVWSPDFNATLDSIGANAMLSELLNVKKQGGTLGALSEGEGKALRDAAVNVTKSQSEKQLDANLAVYRMQIQRSVDLLKQAYEADYQSGMYEGSPPQSAQQAASSQDVEIDELLKKYGAQ